MESSKNKNDILIGNRYIYNKDDIIERRGYESVYKGLDSKTKENVAIKEIYFEDSDKKISIINDINLMNLIDSFYSIKLIDKFIDGKFFYIIMELCDDNLYNYVKNHGKLKIEILYKFLN